MNWLYVTRNQDVRRSFRHIVLTPWQAAPPGHGNVQRETVRK